MGMPEAIWRDSPSVPLLQWLARGSLKQNLLQAVRLWVWLHLLYEPETRLSLPDPFSYADLRKVLFTSTHPQGDEKPDLHVAPVLVQKLPQLGFGAIAWL